ncbi:hypothetical protein OE88DRAFT_20311 [Heliocybe sulcata]|uniref:Uncharacterized protein n=1 Tax=Heliocybe sulcata TaxID=5364 RepID=A0A5C3NGG7_9AGAM|nr:hypothetical protein OE88DRAFT_20311 [Heliocybe sulcata]
MSSASNTSSTAQASRCASRREPRDRNLPRSRCMNAFFHFEFASVRVAYCEAGFGITGRDSDIVHYALCLALCRRIEDCGGFTASFHTLIAELRVSRMHLKFGVRGMFQFPYTWDCLNLDNDNTEHQTRLCSPRTPCQCESHLHPS